ncbi:uncharacterized protein PgNI_08559 [Pyricularia grisea]|uniref:Uncharacterized protein n=1 Tax=Pyricularia grisea TaxID=148305 RepID=A0A6P8AUS9_PYRGI|nr:uncharacterized protein PgNI_08559 [Pyricularia grisea]TLD05978.1 hypothetical protein PgNI_08559 [Pyricularia grisea]
MPRNSLDATKSTTGLGALRRFSSTFSLKSENSSEPNGKPESSKHRFTKMLGTVFPTTRRRSPSPVTKPKTTPQIPAQSSPRTTPVRSATASPIRREQIRIIRDPLPIRPPRPFCPATNHIIASLQRGSSPVRQQQPPDARQADITGDGSLVLYKPPPPTPTQQQAYTQQFRETQTHRHAAGSPRPPTRDTATPTSPFHRNDPDHARQPPPQPRQETPHRVRPPHMTAGRRRSSPSPDPASIMAAFPSPPSCPPPPEWIREQAAAGNPAWKSSMSDSGPSRRSLLWKRLKRWGERVRGRLGPSSRSRRLRGKGKVSSGAEGVDDKRPMSDPSPPPPRPCSSVYSTGSGTCFAESEGRASAAGARLSWPGSSRPPVGASWV